MRVTRFLIKIAILLIVLPGMYTHAAGQDISWIKGIWKMKSGTPYLVPPVSCTNTLDITSVADSSFTGKQITCFKTDTAVSIMYNCTGLLTGEMVQFRRQNIIYKNNSNHSGYEWNECADHTARSCSLYVEHNTVLLSLTTKDEDSACNGTIVYFRNLDEFDTITQQRLVRLYSKPSYTGIYTAYTPPATHATSAKLPEQNNPSADSSITDDGNLPVVLKERINKLAQTIAVSGPNIDVILLDDAEIDGDIVSLYDNNVEVLHHKMIGKEVVKYSFKADKQHAYHELVLVAENLGSIPPNTALMRIRAGDKKYELTTRANMHENAKVIIEYTGE